MIIEYDVVCFERTLKITFPDGYKDMKDVILGLIDRHYTFWHNTSCVTVQNTCLEEFIVDLLYEEGYKWEKWDSIPYGNDYEQGKNLWVCEHCLMAIESREGNQVTLKHHMDDIEEGASVTLWICKDDLCIRPVNSWYWDDDDITTYSAELHQDEYYMVEVQPKTEQEDFGNDYEAAKEYFDKCLGVLANKCDWCEEIGFDTLYELI